MTSTTTPKLHKRREAAALLQVSVSSLDRWRVLGTGPVYRKLNGGVFYELADLQQFIDKSARVSTGRAA